MHERIEAIAARSPEALAVSDARGSLTYAELNARANQLARLLPEGARGHGGAEFAVAVVCDGAIGDVVAMLAIAKAGGASVPIDPSFPDQRILHLLGDSSARVVIAAEHHHQRITGLAAIAFLSVDDEAALTGAQNDLGSSIDNRRLAYIVTPPVRQGSPRESRSSTEPGKPHCMAPRRLRTRGGRSRDAHRRGGVRRGNLGAGRRSSPALAFTFRRPKPGTIRSRSETG